MYLLCDKENSIGMCEGREMEVELILFAKAHFADRCANIADDARGQASGINFLYMAVKDDRF